MTVYLAPKKIKKNQTDPLHSCIYSNETHNTDFEKLNWKHGNLKDGSCRIMFHVDLVAQTKAISRVEGVRIFKFSVNNFVTIQVPICFDPVKRTNSYDLQVWQVNCHCDSIVCVWSIFLIATWKTTCTVRLNKQTGIWNNFEGAGRAQDFVCAAISSLRNFSQ